MQMIRSGIIPANGARGVNVINQVLPQLDTIYHGDALTVMWQWPDECVDIVITSPVYKDSDGYSFSYHCEIWEELFRLLKPGHLFFMNFGSLAEDKLRPFREAIQIERAGFAMQETFVWIKNHFRPLQGKKRVNNLTEFIFMFSKGQMPDIDRLAVGVPYQDKGNIGRYASKDLRCAGNVWHIPYETLNGKNAKLHNDRFPEGLPERCIKLAGLVGSGAVVLDPFMGSGTTALVAKRIGCHYLGCEMNADYIDIAERRVSAEQAGLF